ncbi:MAG: 2-amino-4-hydroxy-6-hydroxymethyldihydropteridine diphosphokinase, partial [Candidatus Competibacterales bacterium]|nr:2-amino-4-hydroxy-6-hydroxymethyldihydropteridine diphosphokinase [Candidatus Competibacterales bacterium]
MRIHLGLGSNLGDRRQHLRQALRRLREHGLDLRRCSPVVESPAWLPDTGEEDWNQPFLNLVVEAETQESPYHWRERFKAIEAEIGPPPASRWAPRQIDIDILLWGEQRFDDGTLRIPRAELTELNFLLTPLLHLSPELRLPGQEARTLLQWSCHRTPPIPLWMGIVNLTPDSFSDGGQFDDWQHLEPHLEAMLEAGVHIVDLGA